jgi:hypothetical protein
MSLGLVRFPPGLSSEAQTKRVIVALTNRPVFAHEARSTNAAGNATRLPEPNPTKQFRKKTSPEFVDTPRGGNARAVMPAEAVRSYTCMGSGGPTHSPSRHRHTTHLGVPLPSATRHTAPSILPLSAPPPTSASQQKPRPRGRGPAALTTNYCTTSPPGALLTNLA